MMGTRILFSFIWLASIVVLENVFPHIEGRSHRLSHAFPNLSLGGINAIITFFVFTGASFTAMRWAETQQFGVLHFIRLSGFLGGFLAFILFDLWMYVWHRANHRIAFLWRFHKAHHTDLEMDSTTALRFHPGEIIFSSILRLAVIPLIGINPASFVVYSLLLQPVILFHHSNIGLPERWDKILRFLIVTPNMHRPHHSQEREESDSNYSSIFSCWDRLFDTYRQRKETRTITFGVRSLIDGTWQGLGGILLTPFQKK